MNSLELTLLLCSIFVFGFQLGKKRKVTIQDFKGRTFVSIREFYTKDGKELPSSKGKIALRFYISIYHTS